MSKGQTDEWVVHISDALPFRFIGGAGVKVARGLVGQAATDNAVAGLLAAYKKPHRKPSPGVRVFGGGGQPTITVAAFDASGISISKSDLQCEGSNDDQMIQQAFDMLPARGGKIVLTEGTYRFGPVGVVLPAKDFHFHGMGRDATRIIADEAADYLFIEGLTAAQTRQQQISDMKMDCDNITDHALFTPATSASQNFVLVDNIWVIDATSHGFFMNRPAGEWKFRRCLFESCTGAGVFGSEAGVSAMDCWFTANTQTGLQIALDGSNRVINNMFTANTGGGLGVNNAVVGGAGEGICMGNHFLANGNYGISIQDGSDWIISGNLFDDNASGSINFGAGAFGVSEDCFVTGNVQVDSGTFTNFGAGSSAIETNNVINGTLVP